MIKRSSNMKATMMKVNWQTRQILREMKICASSHLKRFNGLFWNIILCRNNVQLVYVYNKNYFLSKIHKRESKCTKMARSRWENIHEFIVDQLWRFSVLECQYKVSPIYRIMLACLTPSDMKKSVLLALCFLLIHSRYLQTLFMIRPSFTPISLQLFSAKLRSK